MYIIQLTDLHIDAPGEETYGIDVRQNFLDAVAYIVARQPDYVVVSGDLCLSQASPAIYVWIKIQLDAMAIPYFLLSGNHDDPRVMSDSFDCPHLLQGGELYYAAELSGETVLFLDTTARRVSDAQLDWLRAQMAALPRELLLFMHHPPCIGGVPFMDRLHGLLNMAEVQAVLHAHGHPINVFTGHYHVDKTIQEGLVNVHITPSSFYQINQHEVDFAPDHRRVGLRHIWKDGPVLRHSVHYL